MEEAISLNALKALIEKKMKKKILVKVIWNNYEKITLFITPNLKINSFVYDEKEGYLFFDNDGKLVERNIPCILSEAEFAEGKVLLEGTNGRRLMINNQHLSNEDFEFLKEYQSH
ncbi:hypothetical protein [Virgibacillus doumboii]|uniref:hypothetical protein n=1 Tax=Virgibacillus doumboii TaxID=2697503 RepID=UPI0013E0BBEB|nr:hypothetical protein [Virgibacillus doumboii]